MQDDKVPCKSLPTLIFVSFLFLVIYHGTHLEGVDVVCTELLPSLDLPHSADLLDVVAARHPAPHHVGATRVIYPEKLTSIMFC